MERDWDFMSHGIYNTQYIETYTEEQEREFYQDSIETLKKHTGKQLKGMLGPAMSNTARTPDLMAEAGLIYHADWMHDDQPVPIRVKTGRMISVPYSIEVNDSALFGNHFEGEYFAKICKAQFDRLYREGEEERTEHVHSAASIPDRTAASDQVSGRDAGICDVARGSVAGDGGTRLRSITWQTTMTGWWAHLEGEAGLVMPGQRGFGMDHPHHPWLPMVKRAPLRWPEGARGGVVRHCEPGAHGVANRRRGTTGGGRCRAGFGNRRFPDYTRKTHREYGHRVGIFRVLDALEAVGIRPTIAMDLMTAENYPYLVEHCLGRGAEIMAHGVSVTQMITSEMGEDEERGYIRRCLEGMESATGTRPRGWLGPEFGESARTPGLLAEAGVEYVCDWTLMTSSHT